MGTFPARLSFSCNSRVEIAGQTGSFARRIVVWRLQHAFEVACDESAPMRFGRQIQFLARTVEPFRAIRDVTNFVAQDAVEDARGRGVASGGEPLDRRRRDVEPARFEHHRHDREARQRVVRGRLLRFPEAVMRVERAVIAAERPQAAIEQREVHRFVGADRQPVVDKTAREITAAPAGHVEREIDCGELDMRERMDQRDPPALRPALAAPSHAVGREKFGLGGACGTIGHRAVEDVREPATPPVARHRAGALNLGGGVGGFENRSDHSSDRLHRRQPSAFTAASTCSTCPGTLTLRHTLASFPDASNSQVERSIPIYSRPYSTLGTHAPNASITPFSSLASGTVTPYFAVNLACLAGVSFDTPSKAAPALANSAAIALKSWASLVQPAVSSFG